MSTNTSKPLSDRAVETGKKADHIIEKSTRPLLGQAPNDGPETGLGHPLHPSTVHWPIAVSSVERSETRCVRGGEVKSGKECDFGKGEGVGR